MNNSSQGTHLLSVSDKDMKNSSQGTKLLSVGDNSIFFKVAEGNFADRGKESSYENNENISIEKGKHHT
jgi:hypothetical protein